MPWVDDAIPKICFHSQHLAHVSKNVNEEKGLQKYPFKTKTDDMIIVCSPTPTHTYTQTPWQVASF